MCGREKEREKEEEKERESVCALLLFSCYDSVHQVCRQKSACVTESLLAEICGCDGERQDTGRGKKRECLREGEKIERRSGECVREHVCGREREKERKRKRERERKNVYMYVCVCVCAPLRYLLLEVLLCTQSVGGNLCVGQRERGNRKREKERMCDGGRERRTGKSERENVC